jgi:hypothetical protein
VDYYAATGNPPGWWAGAGLPGLGTGDGADLRAGAAVFEEAMARLFGTGRDPVTGEGLGRPYPTYKPLPKSVSVLWAIGDEATRDAVEGAHRDAVAAVLGLVENRILHTRIGAGSLVQVPARGVLEDLRLNSAYVAIDASGPETHVGGDALTGRQVLETVLRSPASETSATSTLRRRQTDHLRALTRASQWPPPPHAEPTRMSPSTAPYLRPPAPGLTR